MGIQFSQQTALSRTSFSCYKQKAPFRVPRFKRFPSAAIDTASRPCRPVHRTLRALASIARSRAAENARRGAWPHKAEKKNVRYCHPSRRAVVRRDGLPAGFGVKSRLSWPGQLLHRRVSSRNVTAKAAHFALSPGLLPTPPLLASSSPSRRVGQITLENTPRGPVRNSGATELAALRCLAGQITSGHRFQTIQLRGGDSKSEVLKNATPQILRTPNGPRTPQPEGSKPMGPPSPSGFDGRNQHGSFLPIAPIAVEFRFFGKGRQINRKVRSARQPATPKVNYKELTSWKLRVTELCFSTPRLPRPSPRAPCPVSSRYHERPPAASAGGSRIARRHRRRATRETPPRTRAPRAVRVG
ncbi:MAG: hypothetical protein BJ554DRAFT_2498 [Olpidium bornovanus]|uniref:Uncharacterized protein n=1 Tax=Olpidium bornovanus TaxID=278681 RepID=A0A8H8DGD5_9FUNG|nr:MAG: hypothetical protein BJ554DRAFT_2498 [Olpidium bornovanus]